MKGSYDAINEQLKDSYRRESKPLTVLATGDVYDVIFRRSQNKNTTKNYGTIFYFKSKKEIKQGRTILFRDKHFLVLNQEELENDIYYRSDIVQTNCVLETLTNRTQVDGINYADETTISAFASNMKSNATINGSVITTIGGRFDLMAEDNIFSRLILLDDIFTGFGGNVEVTGIYFLEGFAHISLERTVVSAPTRVAKLNLVQGEFYAGYGYNQNDFASPVVTELDGENSNEYIINNATINVISSDESIAKYNHDIGIIETFNAGNVTLTFTWIERDISIDVDVIISAYIDPPEPKPYAVITSQSGADSIKQGTRRKYFVNFYAADGTNINDVVTPQWEFEMLTSDTTFTFAEANNEPTGNAINWTVTGADANGISMQLWASGDIDFWNETIEDYNRFSFKAYIDDPTYGHVEDTFAIRTESLF